MKRFNDEFMYQYEAPEPVFVVNGEVSTWSDPLWVAYYADGSQFDTFESEAELISYLNEISEESQSETV